MKNIIVIAILLLGQISQAEIFLEPLYGHLKTSQGVAVQVYSGGCTEKRFFKVVKKLNAGVQEIYLKRQRPDYCEAFLPYGTLIYFTYKDLGLQSGDTYRIMNPDTQEHLVL